MNKILDLGDTYSWGPEADVECTTRWTFYQTKVENLRLRPESTADFRFLIPRVGPPFAKFERPAGRSFRPPVIRAATRTAARLVAAFDTSARARVSPGVEYVGTQAIARPALPQMLDPGHVSSRLVYYGRAADVVAHILDFRGLTRS